MDGSMTRSAGDGGESGSGQIAWVSEQAQLYDQGATAPAIVCNNFVASLAMIGDVLARPNTYIQTDAGRAVVRYPTQSIGGADVMVVGAGFAANIADAPALQRDYVLALRDVVREQRTMRSAAAAAGRGAGLNPWFLGGIVVVAAGLIYYLGTDAIRAQESLRREHMELARAASDRAEGLRVFRETGMMPAPSATETAVAGAIATRAAREAARTTAFDTIVAAAASGVRTGVSYGIPLAIAGVVLLLLVSKRKG